MADARYRTPRAEGRFVHSARPILEFSITVRFRVRSKMVAKLHATLKRFYPMRNICNILEGHFAKLDQLDHKVSSNNMNGAALHDIATNDAALLQGVTF